jgi:alpha-beta hydrolase superfamily lysophospholipase
MRKLIGWLWCHPKLTATLALLTLFILLNILAYRHARAMTHFVAGGPRKWRVDRLSAYQKLDLVVNGLRVTRPQDGDRPDDLGLNYEAHTFPGGAGRLSAWYVPHADSRGLVLLFHGYSVCKDHLLPEAEAFNELGYSCFLVDFRGSGESSGSETSIGYYEADDVATAVAYARERWAGQPLYLYGQSMGSAAILRALAVHKITADAAIVECPFDRLLRTVEARFEGLNVPVFPGARLLLFWGGLQMGFNPFGHNPMDYARRVTCPVLLLHGKDDTRVKCDDIERIFKNLRGEKRLHLFEDLGHESYVAKQAAEWKDNVGRFLTEKDTGRDLACKTERKP